jgi:hypothetical protein
VGHPLHHLQKKGLGGLNFMETQGAVGAQADGGFVEEI